MTKEEAIKYIEYCMCEGRLVGNTKPIIDEKWQAGVMAIEALRAQKVGKWNVHISCIDGRKLFVCPFCSCGFYIPVYERKYCPNCGAKMEGINE